MGGRYLVTGVQLAMLKMDCNCNELIDDIIEEQFVFDSDKNINNDVENISEGKHHANK